MFIEIIIMVGKIWGIFKKRWNNNMLKEIGIKISNVKGIYFLNNKRMLIKIFKILMSCNI